MTFQHLPVVFLPFQLCQLRIVLCPLNLEFFESLIMHLFTRSSSGHGLSVEVVMVVTWYAMVISERHITMAIPCRPKPILNHCTEGNSYTINCF